MANFVQISEDIYLNLDQVVTIKIGYSSKSIFVELTNGTIKTYRYADEQTFNAGIQTITRGNNILTG